MMCPVQSPQIFVYKLSYDSGQTWAVVKMETLYFIGSSGGEGRVDMLRKIQLILTLELWSIICL